VAGPLLSVRACGGQTSLTIQATGARTLVTDGPDTADVGDHELVEAVMGRLDETSRLNAKLRELLSIKP
jgi:hypothetical protein